MSGIAAAMHGRLLVSRHGRCAVFAIAHEGLAPDALLTVDEVKGLIADLTGMLPTMEAAPGLPQADDAMLAELLS